MNVDLLQVELYPKGTGALRVQAPFGYKQLHLKFSRIYFELQPVSPFGHRLPDLREGGLQAV